MFFNRVLLAVSVLAAMMLY